MIIYLQYQKQQIINAQIIRNTQQSTNKTKKENWENNTL